MKGLSPTNLQYMRAFAAAWPDPISQRPVGKLPWGHVCTLLDQVKDPALRDWYADRDARNGWSRPVLEHHVATGLHHRTGAAPSNFDQHLDPVDADQAREIVSDPYVFDFLDLTERSTERTLEQALTDRLQDTLAELGPGFAFVGRQPVGTPSDSINRITGIHERLTRCHRPAHEAFDRDQSADTTGSPLRDASPACTDPPCF
jgi:predicted nuclease of restriction endonuclease-like (RecB) superfamily